MAEAAPALSEYEELRVANILRNAAELKRLGLDVAAHTMAALGKQAPTARTQKRAVRPKGAPLYLGPAPRPTKGRRGGGEGGRGGRRMEGGATEGSAWGSQ